MGGKEPNSYTMKRFFDELDFPAELRFQDFWRPCPYRKQPTWACCLHEIGHYAVLPNWYLERLCDGHLSFYIRSGCIPSASMNPKSILISQKDNYLSFLEENKDWDEAESFYLNVWQECSNVFPNEWGVRAWCLMVLEQRRWITPAEVGGFWYQWTDPVGKELSPYYRNEHILGDGYSQLAYWGMDPALRPFK